jgi:hypothetical protein
MTAERPSPRSRTAVTHTFTAPGRALRVTIDGACDWTHTYPGHIEESRRHFDG